MTEIVSGGAHGVDILGERNAHENKISIKRFIHSWNKYGKRAGILRNQDILDYVYALVAVWNGRGKNP